MTTFTFIATEQSITDLRHRREMCQDVLAENPDSPYAPKMSAMLEQINARFAALGQQAPAAAPTLFEEPTVSQPTSGTGSGSRSVSNRASDKQIAFAKKLLADKDMTGVKVTVPADLDNMSATSARAIIDSLVNRPWKTSNTATARPATEKQVTHVVREGARRQYDDAAVKATVAKATAGEPITFTEASKALDVLFNAPFTPRGTTSAAELEIGIYRTDDDSLYKVYPAQSGGRMFAKLLVLPEGWMELTYEQRKALVESGSKPEWNYQGMAHRFVKAEQKLSLEEAKAFGTITSVCGECGHLLTDEESIANGIGPVCAGKY